MDMICKNQSAEGGVFSLKLVLSQSVKKFPTTALPFYRMKLRKSSKLS